MTSIIRRIDIDRKKRLSLKKDAPNNEERGYGKTILECNGTDSW